MTYSLSSKNVTLQVDHPLKNYQGSRFDCTGKIINVKFKGIEISGVERIQPENTNILGRGFYNEFGMENPIGYDEAKPGDWFHKIGIGLLQRDENPYSFLKNYPIKPAQFEVEESKLSLKISCIGDLNSGYAYLLYKEIKVLENGFEIKSQLKNTGNKTIKTNEYNHNFIAINKEPIDENIGLKLPFFPKREDFFENVDPEKLISIKGNLVELRNSPSKDFFLGKINGEQSPEPNWELTHKKLKFGISEIGDFKLQKFNLWGCNHVISPEMFFEINLAPHQEVSWSRKYIFTNF